MSLTKNRWGFVCTWCGEAVESVTDPDDLPYGGPPVGVCEKDGIVYVERQ